jgi:hypothetical protein
MQCCRTVTINCRSGYGSQFSQDLVPVPDPDLFITVFTNKTFVQDLAFSMLDAALFPRKLRFYNTANWEEILGKKAEGKGRGGEYLLEKESAKQKRRNKEVQGRGDTGTSSNKSPKNAVKTTVPRYSKLL